MTTKNDDSPPPSLCWNCRHGCVLVISRSLDPESAFDQRVRTEVSNCSHPMIAPVDEPYITQDPVLECQGFSLRIVVAPTKRRRSKSKVAKKSRHRSPKHG